MLSCKSSRPAPPGWPFPGHSSMKATGEAAAQSQPGFEASLVKPECSIPWRTPQAVPDVPGGSQRRPLQALKIYPNAPAPLTAAGPCTFLPPHEAEWVGSRSWIAEETLSSACKSCPHQRFSTPSHVSVQHQESPPIPAPFPTAEADVQPKGRKMQLHNRGNTTRDCV